MVTIGDLRGGRNGTDPPLSLPQNQAVEVLNMDWKEGTIGRKRGGADAVTETGGTAFTGPICALMRHVPGNDEAAAEFWGFGAAAPPTAKRMTGGTSWADVTFDDLVSTAPQHAVGATLNGKLFLAYDSAQDRLHVYDPALASPRVRRVGIAPGAIAPTVANTGSGTYAATLRYYRVRFIQLSGSIVVRRSEATPSVSFTPSGTGTGVIITRPTAPGEGETHWEVESSLDNTSWGVLHGQDRASSGPIVIATTTASHTSNPPADIPLLPVTYPAGTYGLFPSVKYLVADGNRLLGAGAWETAGTTSGGKNSRIWFTPVLGSSDKGDDERVPNTTTQKNWIDLNENDGGAVTGIGGPIDGAPWAFKYRQVWKLVPTGTVSAPYQPFKRADGIGCIAHKSIVMAEDEAGRPALYFLSHRGPYRVSASGMQYLGRDNEDIWGAMSLGATTIVAHSVWHADIHQIWFWIASGSANEPDVKMVFDVKLGHPDGQGQIRGGWAKHDGLTAAARCSTMFANTLGASMSRDFKPYIGRASGSGIWRCDTATTTDAGTAFRAYATTKPLPASEQLSRKLGTNEPHLLAKAQAATMISVSVVRDFGLETRSATASIAAAASETRVIRRLDGLEMAGASVVQMTVGDASAVASAWTLDALAVPVKGLESTT